VPELAIPYGREALALSLPEGLDARVLRGQPMPALPDPVAVLREALADPVGQRSLKDLCAGKDNAVVVVADYTRYNAYEVWLPALLEELVHAGIPAGRISLYVGSGTHRPMTADEKAACFTPKLCRRFQVLDHDCDAMDRMEKAGRTDYGTSLFVDSRVSDAEVLILTGGIQYHYFAGYTGGRKAVLPSVAGRESICHNHSLAYDRSRGTFGERVRPGVLVDNPVSEDMHEAAMLLKPDLCVNVVLNSAKEVAWLGAGDHGYVLRLGAAFLDEHSRLACDRPADIAVIGAGGYPKDVSLFQAHKSLRHTLGALSPGATIIWVARCEEGEGPRTMAAFRDLTPDGARDLLEREFNLGSLCSFSLKHLSAEYAIHMVTELDPGLVRAWGMTPHSSLQEALSKAVPAMVTEKSWVVGEDMSNLLVEIPAPAVSDGGSDEEQQT